MITNPLLSPVGGMHFFTSDFIETQSLKASGDLPDLQIVQAKYLFMNAFMKLKHGFSILNSSISILTFRDTNPFRIFEVLLPKLSNSACSKNLGFITEQATVKKLVQQVCSASISRNAPPLSVSNPMAKKFYFLIFGVVVRRVALKRY